MDVEARERVIIMATPSLLDDVEHWLNRAATMRELADMTSDPAAKLAMLKLVAEYCFLAQRAMEHRQKDNRS